MCEFITILPTHTRTEPSMQANTLSFCIIACYTKHGQTTINSTPCTHMHCLLTLGVNPSGYIASVLKESSVHSRTRAFMSISRMHTPRYVMKNNSSKFIVPTYDIDLMWHAHQMYPIAYEQVCPCRYVHVLLAPFCRQCVIRCLVFLL